MQNLHKAESTVFKYAVFGNPIAHSLSPLIHSHFAKECGEDLSYGRVLVPEGDFVSTARDFLAKGGLGFNITVPCKGDAYQFIKESGTLAPAALAAGAVNTIALKDGKLIGDNTDGFGLTLDLKRLEAPLEKARVLMIGAGGAVRGVMQPLFEVGRVAEIVLCNRTLSKAQDLAAYFQGLSLKVTACSFEDLSKAGAFDLIINASSSSLYQSLPPISDEVYKKAVFGYDLMYNRQSATIFTEHLKDLGLKSADGLGMLVAQAARSFEIWRGVQPDIFKTLEYVRGELKA